MALTLKKLAIKDPESTDIITLSNIMDGVDGAAAFGWSQPPENVTIEDNQTLQHSEMGELEVKVLRNTSADTELIKGLINSYVELSGYGITDFLVFREQHMLNRNPDYNSAIVNDRINVTNKKPIGYVDTTANQGVIQQKGFYAGHNALALYNVLSGDGDKLYGFNFTSGASGSQSGQVQTVTTDTEGEGMESEMILFPFEGATLIASADFSEADERFRVGLRFYDANKAQITEEYSDYVQSGRRSHEAVVPVNAAYFTWITTRDAASGTQGSWKFEQPAVKLTDSKFSL